MYVFLGLNGLHIESSEAEAVDVMLGLASGTVTEAALAAWLRVTE